MGFFEKVYKMVVRVPAGKVVTYGQIAKALGTKDARKVGWALHANSDPGVPCHRVVNKDGKLSENFAGPQRSREIANGRQAFDGWREQRKRLLAEGVGFIDERTVDLKRCGFAL